MNLDACSLLLNNKVNHSCLMGCTCVQLRAQRAAFRLIAYHLRDPLTLLLSAGYPDGLSDRRQRKPSPAGDCGK